MRLGHLPLPKTRSTTNQRLCWNVGCPHTALWQNSRPSNSRCARCALWRPLAGVNNLRPPVMRRAESGSFALASARREAGRVPEREAADSILKYCHAHMHQAGIYLPRFFRKGNQVVHINPLPGRGDCLFSRLCGLHHCQIVSVRNKRYRRLAEIDFVSQGAMDDQIACRPIVQ